MTAPTVVNRPTENRFELELEGGTARLDYLRDGEKIVLTHTEVPESERGQGHGAALVHAAAEHARAEGLRVSATCPFARDWLGRNPDYASA